VVFLLEKVINTIKENNMLDSGDKVIVGVSGGPDSICLLHILMGLRERFSLELIAAHVNHGLRGEDSDNDQKYVEEFCRKNQIKFSFIKEDVHKISVERNISCESAGRDVRYEFFKKLKEENSSDKIAIAHNSNDQAETVLMRIMRGTGLEGLSGIKPVREGIYIRPLLYCTRTEIEEYCKKNNLNPRIDKTNFENIYARNKVRLELIPYIEKNFNKHIVNVLNRLAENARVDSEYLEQESEKKYKKYCANKEDKVIITKEAFQEHQAIITRIIRKAFTDLTGGLNNFEKIHVIQVVDLQKNGTGKQTMLPNDVGAYNNYGDIHIYINVKNEIKELGKTSEYKLQMGENTLRELGIKVFIKQIPKAQAFTDVSENVKYFDSDKISKDIILRFRRNGDKFNPLGMSGNKKLKDIFIDMKIPKEERDKIPLICFDDKIAWISGYKVSNSFKIDGSTQKIIQIKLEREEN
jgi:tRNA(Ile)-lysidine synthase